MRQHTIFTLQSPYRDDFRIRAFTFGGGTPELAIVGAMRGDELQQQYIAARMVDLLSKAEAEDRIAPGICISVIPAVNPFSMNIEKRFWALDGTDINRMFPGYDQGETTQRIAAALFEYIQQFGHGVQLASYYLPGDFLPHVSIIRTCTTESLLDEAKKFGLPYVTIRDPLPFDTVLLNYNWQIWDTKAYSLYAGTTDSIDFEAADIVINSLFHYMEAQGMIKSRKESFNCDECKEEPEGNNYIEDNCHIINEEEAAEILAPHAGILIHPTPPGKNVKEGDVVAQIMHPLKGTIVCDIRSPKTGLVFFTRNKSIAYQNTLLFKII